MKKKNLIYYTAIALVWAVMPSACASEDELEPSGTNDNFFKVPDDAQDAESVLRRNFYNDNGIYLLFNDTLRKELVGQDAYGEEVWKVETVDLQYNMTSYGAYSIYIDYLASLSEKQKAVALTEEKILPHLSGGMRPYSILLLNELAIINSSYKQTPTSCYVNMRCMAVAAGEWVNMETDEQESYAHEICKTLVGDKCSYTDAIFDEFHAVSSVYHGEYISGFFSDWDRSQEYAYECGFLTYRQDRSDVKYDYFCTKSTDFNDYFDAVMDMTEEDFQALYGNYPRVMEKYHIMKNAIMELGFIF